MDESKDGMIREDIPETCISPYVKQFTSPGLMHETGSSGLVPWDKPEGWVWEGCARGFRIGAHIHPWLIHVNAWQKSLQLL